LIRRLGLSLEDTACFFALAKLLYAYYRLSDVVSDTRRGRREMMVYCISCELLSKVH
jgi:hypothetical protein